MKKFEVVFALKSIRFAERYYFDDGPEDQLEQTMKITGVQILGNPNSYKNRFNKRGQERQGFMNMSLKERAYRTILIRRLSLNELKKIQQYEIAYMTRFLLYSEMIKILKKTDAEKVLTLSQNQVNCLIAFNNSQRPVSENEFMGLKIPPYFSYDLDFDGMIYHHAWDINSWNGNLVLSENDSPKSGSKSYQPLPKNLDTSSHHAEKN